MDRSEPAAPIARARFPARLLAVRPRVRDVALAAALMVWVVNVAATAVPSESLAGTLLLATGAAAVAARRRYPVAVLAVALVPYVVTPRTGAAQPAVLVALYTVATLRSHRATILAATLAIAASIAAVAIHGGGWALGFARALEVALAAVAGLAVVEHRRRRDRESAMLAQIAAGDERARIARELHDVIAHHLSVIVVQANVAADAVEPDHPAFAPTHAVLASGREALADTRRVLGVLRTHDAGGERGPPPGLGRVEELLARVRSAGLDVTLTIVGEPASIPTALDLTAYRIIQEALTNTIRHARASAACVTIRYTPQAIALEIEDDGIGPSPNGSAGEGYGVAGMRERAALFGGDVDAGPNPGRGYRVSAELPL